MRRQITYDPQRDYYVILGIEASATDDDIRLAYRRAVREVHPDLNPDRQDWATRELQRVNEAYDILSDHTLRRDYDRLRWPHIPNDPARRAQSHASSTFGRSTYDPNRPWWEQVSPAPIRDTPADAPISPRSRRRHMAPPSDPIWLSVAAWLKKRRLTRLNSLWLALVGIWRSPYAGILALLGVVLAVDVALIVFVLVTPYSWADVENWLSDHTSGARTSPTSEVRLTPVSDRLNLMCDNPTMQITAPGIGDVVGSRFAVYGTVQRADVWAYNLAIGFVGQSASISAVPSVWIPVRPILDDQSIPEPAIENGLLTETPVALLGRPAGYYAIRLEVQLRSGETLHPCDIVVRYRADR